LSLPKVKTQKGSISTALKIVELLTALVLDKREFDEIQRSSRQDPSNG
jgi:hypothetical protein